MKKIRLAMEKIRLAMTRIGSAMTKIGTIASAGAAAVFLVAAVWSLMPSESKYLNYLRVKKSAEDNTARFIPGFVHKKHFAIVFGIENYQITDSFTLTKHGLRPPSLLRRSVVGDFPTMKAGGSFQVIFKHGGRSILSYFMPSPLYQRVENGPGKGLFKIKKGSFEIPVSDSIYKLPNLRIILKDHGTSVHTLDFN